MSKSYDTKADKIQADGKVPVKDYQTGLLAHAVGAVLGPVWVAPCDLYIERIGFYVGTLASSAAAVLNLGTTADDDAYLDGYVVYNLAAGYYEVDMGAATTISRTIPRGTAFQFNLGAATAVGNLSAFAVLRPL